MGEFITILADKCIAYFYSNQKRLIIVERDKIVDDHAFLEIMNIDETEARSIVSRVTKCKIV